MSLQAFRYYVSNNVQLILFTYSQLKDCKSRYYFTVYLFRAVGDLIKNHWLSLIRQLLPGNQGQRPNVLENFTPTGIARTMHLEQRLAPVQLKISGSAPSRINILMPTIDPTIIFAGYIAVFNLILRMQERKYRTRIIITEKCNYSVKELINKTTGYDGLQSVLRATDFLIASNKQVPIEVSPTDEFFAYSVWDAFLAHQAVQTLGKPRFFFLIQEYEPVFHPHNSVHALSSYAYSLPHYAIFNSEMLREYFRLFNLGVFSSSDGDQHCLTFRHAIKAAQPPSASVLSQRSKRKLLFYARPEEHASRNLFEIGLIALKKAVESKIFGSLWEFEGIGSTSFEGFLSLSHGRKLNMVPRRDPKSYWQMLSGYDIGLCLMYAPHPSVPNLEMAAAGVITVTSIYINRPKEAMEAISRNLIAVEPNIEAIVAGLKEAVQRVENYEERIRNAEFSWPREWKDSFSDSFMDRLELFIKNNS